MGPYMKCQSNDTFGKLFCNENWQESLHLQLKSNLVERTNNETEGYNENTLRDES